MNNFIKISIKLILSARKRLLRSLWVVIKSITKKFITRLNMTVYKYPYAIIGIVSILMFIFSAEKIMQERARANSYDKDYVLLRMKYESLKNCINE